MRKPPVGKNIAIIGSGIGGLTAGIMLALLQYDVTVVEKNPLPGGLMRSYRRQGIDCPVGVHYVGALGETEPLGRIFRLLGINVADIFEKMSREGIIDRYIFDKFVFDLPADINAYEKNLLDCFPGETAAINIIMDNLREIGRSMLEPSFLAVQGDPFRNMDYFQPLGDLFKKLGLSDGLRSVLAVPAQLIGVPADRCPVIFHFMVLAGYLFSSWRLKENGGRMADAFASRFKEVGGRLIAGDGASKIMLEAGKAAGLQLQSGITLPADAVIAAIHPKVLAGLLAREALKDSYRQRIEDLQETDGVIVVQVQVAADEHGEPGHNIYRLHEGEEGRITSGVFYQLRRSNLPGFNLLSIITKSLYGEWSRWKNTKPGRRGIDYEEKKRNMAENLLQEAGEVFGDFRSARIIDVFTPLTLRDHVNCPEGACYGVMHSADQLMKIATLGNIPVPGLYLAGQNVVAPGVLGSMLGAFKTVRKIISPERFAREINRTE